MLGSIHWDCHKGTSFLISQINLCVQIHMGMLLKEFNKRGIIHGIVVGWGGGIGSCFHHREECS